MAEACIFKQEKEDTKVTWKESAVAIQESACRQLAQ
jgi:hypothetical protein